MMSDEKFVVAKMYHDDCTAEEVLRYIVENRVRNREMAKVVRRAGLSRDAMYHFRSGGGVTLYSAQEFLAACGYRLKVEVIE